MNTLEPPREHPLSGFARTLLVVTTSATIVLFYAFITLTILALLVWNGLILMVTLALARFGLAGLIAKFLEREFRLLAMLARSLWLSEGAKFRLPLQVADAPALFAMIQSLAARLSIPAPDEVCLEMNCGAWVELRGVKTGLGTTRVGIGYDLLIALKQNEVEAVMAHELAHAKLIGRAFNNWLMKGLRRAATITNNLGNTVDSYRRASQSGGVAEWILWGSHTLTLLCSRQISAYSRQGEFEADALAAELCGTNPMRSALQRLEAVQPTLNRLPWNERMAQIESPAGLSQWLLKELESVAAVAEEIPGSTRGDYSTHPSLASRLAALPANTEPTPNSPSGIQLIAQPDRIALKLVDAIERSLLAEEKKDLGNLKSWLKQIRKIRDMRIHQVPGVLLVLIGLIVGPIAWFSELRAFGLILMAATIPLGIFLYRLGYYRDRKRAMPVPNFETFMRARNGFPIPDLVEKQKHLEEELRSQLALESSKKNKAARLTDWAYEALATCDYLRAHVAARLVVDYQKNSIDRAVAMMIAAAAFDQGEDISGLLQFVVKKTEMRSPSTSLAGSWTFLLCRDWMPAEALLHETMKSRPKHADLLAMLAFCQWRRGKLQSALANIRDACTPTSPTTEHRKLFINILLDRGALREAAAKFEEFSVDSLYDSEIVQLRVRLHLLRREFEEAEKHLAMLDLAQLAGHQLLTLAFLYENARIENRMLDFLHRALTRGHYPEAQLALARHAQKNKNLAAARTHILSAIDTTKTLGEKSVSPYDVFHNALAHLLDLEEPRATCRTWIAGFLAGTDAGPLSQRSVVVYASTEKEAENYVTSLVNALRPDRPPMTATYTRIKAAPRDMQPVQPVRPGVQYVYQ